MEAVPNETVMRRPGEARDNDRLRSESPQDAHLRAQRLSHKSRVNRRRKCLKEAECVHSAGVRCGNSVRGRREERKHTRNSICVEDLYVFIIINTESTMSIRESLV
jgi:hypothetical protein